MEGVRVFHGAHSSPVMRLFWRRYGFNISSDQTIAGSALDLFSSLNDHLNDLREKKS
jgi:hypothetical protein